MKQDGVWAIGAPITTDPITNEVKVLDVPAATQDIQLLLWDSPTKEQWDSVFIDGEYNKTVDGVTTTVSKNFIQGIAMQASNFQGSALEALVIGTDSLVKELAAPAPVAADPLANNDPLAALGL